jgi:ribosomal protein S18 acetylase RimI-like enzyme
VLKIIRATLNNVNDIGYVHAMSWKKAYQGIVPQPYLDQLTPESRSAFFKKVISISNHEFYLAYLSELPIGMMSIGKSRDDDLDDHVGEVSAIYLMSDYWGKGYGRRMMDFAVNRLKNQSYQAVTLWVLEDNHRARTFYEKFGYVFDGKKEEVDIGGKLLTELRYTFKIN